MCRYAAAVEEDRDIFLGIDGDRDRLAQLARTLGVAADDRVLHVEAGVVNRGRDRGIELDTLRLHGLGEIDLAAGTDVDGLVETVGRYARGVVVALQELVPVRDILLFQAEHDPVDERQRLAGIIQHAVLAIAWLAFDGIGLAVKVRIAFHHHLPVRVVDREHVGAGADRVPVECDVARRKAGL